MSESTEDDDFFDANLNSVVTLYVIDMLDLPALFTAANDNPINGALARAVRNWIKAVLSKQASQTCLNLKCSYKFGEHNPPTAFVIAMPYAKLEGSGRVSGVCPRCAEVGTEGIHQLAMQAYRSVWPDLRDTKEGHA